MHHPKGKYQEEKGIKQVFENHCISSQENGTYEF